MSARINVSPALGQTIEKASRGFITDFTGPGGFSNVQDLKLTDAQAIQMWKCNPWLNSTVNRIVADICKIPPIVRPRDNQIPTERQVRRINKVRALLDNPNENDESFSDIREKVLRDLLNIGRGAMEKVFGEDGTADEGNLTELYALAARNLRIRSDEYGNIPMNRAYKLSRFNGTSLNQSTDSGSTRGTKDEFFDRDEVIFLVYQPVSWSLYGHKPMDTLANTVASDILRAMYNSVFFTNNGEASGILSVQGMSKAELKKLKQYFQARHKGASNAHRMLAVNVPIQWVQQAVTNRDMQFQEYGVELRQKIFAVYGMQPLVMGVLDSSTGRLNSEQQTQAYKDGALKPILRKESYYYTQEIIWNGFGFNDLEMVFPDVELLDTKTQSELDSKDTQAAILTINEVRARRNLPPVTWGDAPIMLLPGGGQINPDTGKVEMPNNTEGDKKPKPEKKPAKKEEKDLSFSAQNYLLTLRKWCLIGYGEHNFNDLRAEFGAHAIKAATTDEEEYLTVALMYGEVVNTLTEKNYRSLDSLRKQIDSIYSVINNSLFETVLANHE
jgi:HK97 family phage portal protein